MGVNNNMNLGSSPPTLNEVTIEGNTTTDNVKFELDADNYILIDTTNQIIKFYSTAFGSLGSSTLLTEIGFGSLNLFNPNNVDDVISFSNGVVTIKDISGGNFVQLSKDKITVYDEDGVTIVGDYPYPTGASSPLATLADIGGSSARTTSTSGTESSPDTQSNYTLIHEAGATPTLTFEFPPNPINNQKVTLMSVGGITALTLTSVVGTIVNAISTLAVGGASTYMYFLTQDKWYKVG